MFLIYMFKTSFSFTWSSDLHWSQSVISAAHVYLMVSLISRRTWINMFMLDVPGPFFLYLWYPPIISNGISASAHFHCYDDIHLTCQIKAVFVSAALKHKRAFRIDNSKKEIGWFLPASQPRESLWMQHIWNASLFILARKHIGIWECMEGSTVAVIPRHNCCLLVLQQSSESLCRSLPTPIQTAWPCKSYNIHMFKHSRPTMQSPLWQQRVLCKFWLIGVSWLCYLTVGTRLLESGSIAASVILQQQRHKKSINASVIQHSQTDPLHQIDVACCPISPLSFNLRSLSRKVQWSIEFTQVLL